MRLALVLKSGIVEGVEDRSGESDRSRRDGADGVLMDRATFSALVGRFIILAERPCVGERESVSGVRGCAGGVVALGR